MEAGDPKPAGGPRAARTLKTHLAHQPLLPSANRYLQHKWDKASYDLHRERVKTARSMLNINPPKVYSHLTLGLKKQQFLEEKALKIQRENTLLLNKIILITGKSGGMDNWNNYSQKSLGKDKRRQEELRIKKENQKIQQHLDHCRSIYDVGVWQRDWHKHLKLMDSMTRYPRGSTNLHKGQDRPVKKPSGCDKEQNKSESNSTGDKKPEENTEKEKNKKAANPTEHAQVTDEHRSADTSPSSLEC